MGMGGMGGHGVVGSPIGSVVCLVRLRQCGFATAGFPPWLRKLLARGYGDPAWLHLHAETDGHKVAYPPIDHAGHFNPWAGICQGAVALSTK